MKPPALTAYMLHRWPYSESSLVLDLFIRERGRVAVIAKGAKRPYSQLRPVLLPFQRLAVQLGKTPVDPANEVHVLRSAEWAGQAWCLGGEALFSGFYLNELLLKALARQDPHSTLFDHYAATLQALAMAEGESQRASAARAFELLLLRACGWLPLLSQHTQTQATVEAASRYRLLADGGVASSGQSDAVAGQELLDMQAALDAGDLAALHACQPSGAAWRAQLQQLLAYHLGERALRGPAVMRELRQTFEVKLR